MNISQFYTAEKRVDGAIVPISANDTKLFIAAAHGQTQRAWELIKVHNVSALLETVDGITPRSVAETAGYWDTAKLLKGFADAERKQAAAMRPETTPASNVLTGPSNY